MAPSRGYKLFSFVLLLAGAAIIFVGRNGPEMLALEAVEAAMRGPGEKSVWMMIVGGVVAGAGVFGLLRR